MKDGAPALIDGITQLKDGAMQLSDGLSQFNEKGIQKLIGTVDDTEAFIGRLKATATVSKNYKSFAGISDDTDGDVKFIYRTDELK
jgi:putative membrane protein